MPRPTCPRCHYPVATCLCDAITETQYDTQIVVLQHPSEVKQAKNTARLISLVVPQTETVVGETEEDFKELRSRLQSNPHAVILYPAQESTALADSNKREPIDTLLIIDGTWRKAKKIWLSNPWLHEMRVCHLNKMGISNYRIRSGSQPGGMASIEAVALALETIEAASSASLTQAFTAMQDKWPMEP